MLYVSQALKLPTMPSSFEFTLHPAGTPARPPGPMCEQLVDHHVRNSAANSSAAPAKPRYSDHISRRRSTKRAAPLSPCVTALRAGPYLSSGVGVQPKFPVR